MAEEATPEEAAEAQPEAAGGGGRKTSPIWIVVFVGVIAIAAGVGFGVSIVFRPPPQTAEAGELPSDADQTGTTDLAGGIPKDDYAYYEFEGITVNLDEPRLARYIRATIILAIRVEKSQDAIQRLEKKKPELTNWLTIFLASRTLEEVRGARSLNRMRREIRDSFNEQLWPNRAPVIEHVLFKDFAVQ